MMRQNDIADMLVGPHNSLMRILFSNEMDEVNAQVYIREFPKSIQSLVQTQTSSLFTSRTVQITIQEYFSLKILQIIKESLETEYLRTFSNNLLNGFLNNLLSSPPVVFFRIIKFYEHFFIITFKEDLATKFHQRFCADFYNKYFLQNQMDYFTTVNQFCKNALSVNNGRNQWIVKEFNNSVNLFSSFFRQFLVFNHDVPTLTLPQIFNLYQIYQDICLNSAYHYQAANDQFLPDMFYQYLKVVLKLSYEFRGAQMMKEFQQTVSEFFRHF